MIRLAPGTVVLCDANVLYKTVLRDLLVRLGIAEVIRPRWTDQIHDEWIRNLLRHRPDLEHSRLQRTRSAMNRAVPEALAKVTAASEHVLPDPDDQHVLDAALSTDAEILMTFNLKHFPQVALPSHLQALHPDAVLLAGLEQQQGAVLSVLRALRADLKKPPLTPLELLGALTRAELPTFAQQLVEHAAQL